MRSFNDYLKEKLKDPKFKEIYEAQERASNIVVSELPETVSVVTTFTRLDLSPKFKEDTQYIIIFKDGTIEATGYHEGRFTQCCGCGDVCSGFIFDTDQIAYVAEAPVVRLEVKE